MENTETTTENTTTENPSVQQSDDKAGLLASMREAQGAQPAEPPTENTESDTTSEPANPDNSEVPAGTAPEQTEEPDKNLGWERVAQVSNGKVRDEETLSKLLESYDQLQAQASQPREPEFETAGQKQAFEFLKGWKGNEVQGLQRFLEVQNLNLQDMSAKDKLFEAFRLDPNNAGLGADRARRIFDQKYEQQFGDVEGDELKNWELEQEVKKAESTLGKIKSDFEEAMKPKPEEPDDNHQERLQQLSSVADGYTGIKLSFEDGSPVNVPATDKEGLKKDLLDPQGFWQRTIQSFVDDKGSFDHKKYAEFIHIMRDPHTVIAEVRKAAMAEGKLGMERELKNIPPQTTTPATPPPKENAASVIAKARKDQVGY